MKIHKKIAIVIPGIGTFSAITLKKYKSRVNLRLKFWGYNWKNMGFHLTSKNKLLLVAPWG